MPTWAELRAEEREATALLEWHHEKIHILADIHTAQTEVGTDEPAARVTARDWLRSRDHYARAGGGWQRPGGPKNA